VGGRQRSACVLAHLSSLLLPSRLSELVRRSYELTEHGEWEPEVLGTEDPFVVELDMAEGIKGKQRTFEVSFDLSSSPLPSLELPTLSLHPSPCSRTLLLISQAEK